MSITIEYSGRLEPQRPERETVTLAAQRDPTSQPDFDDAAFPKAEATYLYSNLSYWYPQSTVTDYATATIRITVPARYACVASGEQARIRRIRFLAPTSLRAGSSICFRRNGRYDIWRLSSPV